MVYTINVYLFTLIISVIGLKGLSHMLLMYLTTLGYWLIMDHSRTGAQLTVLDISRHQWSKLKYKFTNVIVWHCASSVWHLSAASPCCHVSLSHVRCCNIVHCAIIFPSYILYIVLLIFKILNVYIVLAWYDNTYDKQPSIMSFYRGLHVM